MALLRSGFGVLEDAVKKQKQGFTPPAGKLNYFSLEDGEIKVVRFLDDFPVTAKFYEWIVNNAGGTSEFICAPDLYRLDPDWQGQDWVKNWISPTPGIGWQKKFKSDTLSEPKLRELTVGMAVLKEPILGPDGSPMKPPQYQDALEEIDVDDEKHVALHFMLVRQALSNFWDQMVGFVGLYGTICDRDYRIERKGDSLKTTYQAIPLTPDPDWNYDGSSLAQLQAYYGYGVNITKAEGDDVDANNPEGYTWANRFLYAPTTVAEWCERRASEDFANYWLNPKADHLDAPAKGGVTADALLATGRPVDPRQPRTAAPAAAPPAAAPNGAATPAPAPPAAAPVADAAPAAAPAAAPPTPAPAEPVAGDRFEQMRQEMAARQAKATAK